MHKIRVVLFLIVFLNLNPMQAQQISPYALNSAGGTNTVAGITYEWSLAELTLIDTWLTPGLILTNGLLQPFRILPIDDFTIYPNNIITVNGDGENDSWFIGNLVDYPDNEVTIYDRVGRVVYRAKPYLNDWEPALGDLTYMNDTYYYVIKLTKNNKSIVKKGFITIVK